jgi:glyoxylase-like metal-dependent hydrolase (beta-lactamase superfamily II)
MAKHGVPESLIAASAPFFEHIVRESRGYETDRVLRDGDTIRAGGRTLRAVFRPGHSTTDTLFVDEDDDTVFVGDHLLADISSGAEIMPTELPGDERRRALLEYLGNLRKTEAMQISRCYPGHGPVIEDHRTLIAGRIAFHSERLDLIAGHIRDGSSTAFEVARKLWSDEVAEEQPVLVIWEVLGHLDILVNRGTIREHVDDRGHHHFRAKEAVGLAAGTS